MNSKPNHAAVDILPGVQLAELGISLTIMIVQRDKLIEGLSDSEGQQEQLGQERQMGQENPGNLYTKENKESFSENPVPTGPFVPSEEIPDYPHEPCKICGCGDYRLTDQNKWLCSRCHPKTEGETE